MKKDALVLPYSSDEMRMFHSMCEITNENPHLCQEVTEPDECPDCVSPMYDYCGIRKFLEVGKGVVSVQENELLYDIKGAPDQIDSDTWIVIASCNAVRDTVDDRNWALIFNEEDRRWHNYGLIRVTDKMFCCPNCQCQYVYEYDLTKSTPYECFQCKLRFSF